MKTKLSTNVSYRRFAAVIRLLALTVILLFAQTGPVASAEDKKGSERLMDPPRIRPSDLLRCELDIPELRLLIEADHALPEQVVFFNTARRNEPPVRIAMHVRGSGTHRCVLVMIHGVLANHESWRYLTGALGSDFDLWVVDLPGCGDSDKPDPKSLAPDGYSPTAIADRVFQSIEQCLAARDDSPRVILVAHSLGGMTALRMMGDPELRRRYAPVLKQIDGAVLLAPGDVSVNHEMPWVIEIEKLTGLKVKLGIVTGIARDATGQSTISGFLSSSQATRETADQLYNILTHPKELNAARAMLGEAVPWHVKEHRPDWDGIRAIEANYHNVDKPCRIVWGACDEVLPESMGHKLVHQIPEAKLVVLPDCMHSIELECPALATRLIREFHASVHPACVPEASLDPSAQLADESSPVLRYD